MLDAADNGDADWKVQMCTAAAAEAAAAAAAGQQGQDAIGNRRTVK